MIPETEMARVVETMHAIELLPANRLQHRHAIHNGKKIATYDILGKEADANYADLHFKKPAKSGGHPCWGASGIHHRENGPIHAKAILALQITGHDCFHWSLVDETVTAFLTD